MSTLLLTAVACLAPAEPPQTQPVYERSKQERAATAWLRVLPGSADGTEVPPEPVQLRLSDAILIELGVEGRAPLKVEEPGRAAVASADWVVREVLAGQPEALAEGRARWRQQLRLEPRRAGTVPLLLAPLRFREGPGSEHHEVTWEPVLVEVVTTVGEPALSEARDITAIEEIPHGWSWLQGLLWVVLALMVLGLLLGGCELARRRGGRVPGLPAHLWALNELEDIEALALPKAGEVDRYHTMVSDVIRRYLELRFQLEAPRQTTAEFLEAMRRSPALSPPQQALLREFLERCDLAKFAQANPSWQECRAVLGMARAFIEQTVKPRGGEEGQPPSDAATSPG